MIVVVDSSGVRLEGPSDFKRFHVEAPAGADLGAALSASGFGHLDGDDAWVAVAAVRAAAAREVDLGDWEPQFEGMLGYARSKGWLDGDGTHIKAHIERK